MRELFLTSFCGWQYGIWKDQIKSVRDIHALHRIPLSPARIAGILIDNGRAVTLADLSACIGYGHTTVTGQGSILLMEEGEKVTGFAVSGGMDTQPIPAESLFPLPDFLRTPVFDSCAVHSRHPHSHHQCRGTLLQGDEGRGGVFRGLAADFPCSITGYFRDGNDQAFFRSRRDSSPSPAENMDNSPVRPGAVTPLPDMPPYVKGVTFQEGRLLPVIDLSQRIKGRSVVPNP